MIYTARHTTTYHYESPVAQCMTNVRLVPRFCESVTFRQQAAQEWSVVLHPKPAEALGRIDYFGNQVTTYSIYEPHESLVIDASSVVQVESKPMPTHGAGPWEEAVQALERTRSAEAFLASEFRFASSLAPTLAPITAHARTFFPAGANLVECLLRYNTAIYKLFTYTPKATGIETPLEQIFAQRKGVCQDYAHVMLAGLRGLGLAARYVSGYLKSGSEFQGAEASHAWVSAYVPGLGWLDLDPTNNLVPAEGHITLAWGRDFRDVTPVKGVTVGGGEHTLEVAVRVKPKG